MKPNDPTIAAAAIEEGRRLTKGQLLNAVERLLDVDYLANAASVGPSSEAETAIELLRKVRSIQERLDLAWVGAAVAQLFLQHVWLQSVDLVLSSESQYNDAGGSYISHSLRFVNAVPAPNVRVPAEVATKKGGAFNEDAAAEALAAEHEDDAYDFAAPFLPPNVADATTLQLNRDTLAPLLAHGEAVSGLDVARRLWPDHEVVRRLSAQANT